MTYQSLKTTSLFVPNLTFKKVTYHCGIPPKIILLLAEFPNRLYKYRFSSNSSNRFKKVVLKRSLSGMFIYPTKRTTVFRIYLISQIVTGHNWEFLLSKKFISYQVLLFNLNYWVICFCKVRKLLSYSALKFLYFQLISLKNHFKN